MLSSQEDLVLSTHTDVASAADEPASQMMAASSDTTRGTLLDTVLSSLEKDKAEDIVHIDLRGKTAIGDFMVICSGRSTRQVAAISEKLAERVKADHGRPVRMEGKETGDWVLIDTGDVIVHVFRPEVRAFYQLEKMWMPTDAGTSH